MNNQMIVTRDVTHEECHWIYETVKKGTIVYKNYKPTYGCVGSGIAVGYVDGEYPFFEMPRDSVEFVNESR